MGLYTDREIKDNKTITPVWFMRQAGRYHAHYQNIKKNSDFMTMCKTPDLATEITMGPIDEFNFDAAILFSDLLFPLEQLGLGLSYKMGPPKLEVKLDSINTINSLVKTEDAKSFYKFQKQALEMLKTKLPKSKTLLGFVGAPFTLYSYAVEGSHSGNLTESKKGLIDGRFDCFMEKLLPEVLENMCIQAEGNADGLCLFDTAVGELTIGDFKKFALPKLKWLTKEFKKRYPDVKLTYYSKLTHLNYLQSIEDENIDVLGLDWRNDLPKALNTLSNDYYIQGNLDPSYLHMPWDVLKDQLDLMWNDLNKSNVNFSKWIAGLGHGVLQHTPEENVLNTVKYIHEKFRY